MTTSSTNFNEKIEKKKETFYSDLESPGVYRTYEIKEKDNYAIFWKAVGYSDKEMRRVSQITAQLDDEYNDDECKNKKIEKGIIEMINIEMKSKECIRVNFVPLSQDTYYYYTNYTKWIFTYGFKNYYKKKTPIIILVTVIMGLSIPIICGISFYIAAKIMDRKKLKYSNDSTVDENEILIINQDE